MTKLTLGAKIYLSAALAGLLIVIAGSAIYVNSQEMKAAQHWVTHTNNVISQFGSLLSMMVDMETGQRGYLMSGDEKFLAPYHQAKEKFDPVLTELQKTVSDNPTQVGRLNELSKLKNDWLSGPLKEEMLARKAYDSNTMSKEAFQEVLKAGKGKAIMDEVRKVIGEASSMEAGLNEKRMAQSEKTAAQTTIWIIFGLGGALLIGGLLLWRTIASGVRNIKVLAAEMLAASEDLNMSSSELSKSSQALAASASQQASSLQETAASLQEITSMTQATSNNATLSSESTAKSSESAQRGQEIVRNMVASMNRINEANEAVMAQVSEGNKRIGAIVNVINEIGEKTKVINDIVFQTKLLSFNASVEAARAGEHGKGFAVVAEEVGNLAAMSGSAAKEISTLLEQSIQQVQNIIADTQSKVVGLFEGSKQRLQEGHEIAVECEQGLMEIGESVSKADVLATQISQAANEQAKGVEQVNIALSQVDQLTQTNSSAAEQASNLSGSLSNQAQAIRKSVFRLDEIVGRDQNSSESAPKHAAVIPLNKAASKVGKRAA